jgi:fructuronate reductase
VRIADAQELRWAVPGALWKLSVAATQRATVVQAIAAPHTRWVTLTVTEKGYTATLARLLLEGLLERRRNGSSGLTLASCDNLQANGHQLRALLLGHCEDAELRQWIETRCAFPCSMVDRIVPATGDPIRQAVQEDLGVQDPTALGVETFWEWVIEDSFVDPGDGARLAAHGVKVTADVRAYEEAKLRMLNGSHTAMALIGAVTGRPHIADCIGHGPIRRFVERLIEREVAVHLARQDWPAYRDALIQRFGNPHLRHSVHQIATDSSLKIPQRWPPSILGQLAQGGCIDHHALAAAAWLRYGLGVDESGQAYEIRDPDTDRLRTLAADQRSNPQASVRALLSQTNWWGRELPQNSLWFERVCRWHRCILDQGVDRSIEQLLEEVP